MYRDLYTCVTVGGMRPENEKTREAKGVDPDCQEGSKWYDLVWGWRKTLL